MVKMLFNLKNVLLALCLIAFSIMTYAQPKRIADLEVHIAHPTEGQEIVGLKTIIKIEAENHGPDDLHIGDTLVISFPGSENYVRVLKSELKKGERITVFDELINATQYASFTLDVYLVEDLAKVGYQDRTLAQTWVDPDSTNNIKSVHFKNMQQATAILEVAAEPNIRVYPNPAYDLLNIQLAKDWSGYSTILVYDILGRIFLEKNVLTSGNAVSINVNSLSKGVYKLVLLHPDQKQPFVTNFLKK